MAAWDTSHRNTLDCDCGGDCCESSWRPPMTTFGQVGKRASVPPSGYVNIATRLPHDRNWGRSFWNLYGDQHELELHNFYSPFGVPVPFRTRPLAYGAGLGAHALPAEYRQQPQNKL